METFRFQDENDYKKDISSILSTHAHTRTSIILAGKHDNHHHSSLRVLARMAETRYQMLEVFSFCDPQKA